MALISSHIAAGQTMPALGKKGKARGLGKQVEIDTDVLEYIMIMIYAKGFI